MKIIGTILIFIMFHSIWGNEKELIVATSLASELLTKLEQNTPFSAKDGEKFFGPVAPIPSLNVFLLLKLGYLNESGVQIKTLPKYSPLGELLRMNRTLFIIGGKTNQISFFPARELRKDITTGKFDIYDKNIIFIYIRMADRKNDVEFVNEKLLCFDYNINGNFFFTYGFSVNGESILKKMGFYIKKHDKYNYPIIEIRDDILANLKVHIEQLEE